MSFVRGDKNWMNNLGIREESLMTLMFLAWENMWMGLSLAKVMKAEG